MNAVAVLASLLAKAPGGTPLGDWLGLRHNEVQAVVERVAGGEALFREAMFKAARSAGDQAQHMIRSGSGADQADSERYYGRARVFRAIGTGVPVEQALAAEAERWRSYAEQQQAKVAAAPKIRRGPSEGHSVIGHRWVGLDTFENQDAVFIRQMVQVARERLGLPPLPAGAPSPAGPSEAEAADLAVLYNEAERLAPAGPPYWAGKLPNILGALRDLPGQPLYRRPPAGALPRTWSTAQLQALRAELRVIIDHLDPAKRAGGLGDDTAKQLHARAAEVVNHVDAQGEMLMGSPAARVQALRALARRFEGGSATAGDRAEAARMLAEPVEVLAASSSRRTAAEVQAAIDSVDRGAVQGAGFTPYLERRKATLKRELAEAERREKRAAVKQAFYADAVAKGVIQYPVLEVPAALADWRKYDGSRGPWYAVRVLVGPGHSREYAITPVGGYSSKFNVAAADMHGDLGEPTEQLGEVDSPAAGVRLAREHAAANKGSVGPSTAPAAPPVEPATPFEADIPLALAQAAHRGTSHVPEKRGEQERADYAAWLAHVREAVGRAVATTPEAQARAQAEFERYRQGYKAKFLHYLHAKGRTISSMITGPSKFPTARARKASDAADNATRELLEWRTRALSAATKAVAHEEMTATGGPLADLERRIAERQANQARWKQINAIVKGKGDAAAKVAAIEALGVSPTEARRYLQPDFSGRTGVPAYAFQNNLKEIRRLEGRLEEEQAKAARAEAAPEGGQTFPFEGGVVEYDHDADRLRIRHSSKPAPEVLAQLRSGGFRWAPSEKAWQRQLTDNAVASARRITGENLPYLSRL